MSTPPPDEHVVHDALPSTGSAVAVLPERDALTKVAPPAVRVAPVSAVMLQLDEQLRYADIFATSTEFKTPGPPAVARAKAALRIIAGAEFGLSPMQSMRGVYVFDGNIALAGPLLFALIDRSPRYRYRIRERTMWKARIDWYVKEDDPLPGDDVVNGWLRLGDSEFTLQQAQRAGLVAINYPNGPDGEVDLSGKDNWRMYPEAMLLWRAASIGAKLYCQSVFFGPIHVPEELNANAITDQAGNVVGYAVPPPPSDAEISADSPFRAQIEEGLAQLRPRWTRARLQIAMDAAGGDDEKLLGIVLEEVARQTQQRAKTAPTGETRGGNGDAPPPPPPPPTQQNAPAAGSAGALDTRKGSIKPRQRSHLFALLNELGIKDKGKDKTPRLEWAAKHDVVVTSYGDLSEAQADALITAGTREKGVRSADDGLRAVVMTAFCEVCMRPHGEEHANECTADPSQPEHYLGPPGTRARPVEDDEPPFPESP